MLKQLFQSSIEHVSTVAQFLRNSRDLLDRCHHPKVTPWGFKLAGHDEMAEGIFEPTETKIVRSVLEDVNILVNAGANGGITVATL